MYPGVGRFSRRREFFTTHRRDANAASLHGVVFQARTQLSSTGLSKTTCFPSGMMKWLDWLHFDHPYEKEFIRFALEEFSTVATRMHAFLSERVVGRFLGGWLERASRWPVEKEREPIAAIFPRLRL